MRTQRRPSWSDRTSSTVSSDGQAARPAELDDASGLLAEEQTAAREVERARRVHVDAADGALADRVGFLVLLVAVVLAREQPAIGADVDGPRGVRARCPGG